MAQPERKKEDGSWKEKSLGTFFTDEGCGRQVVNHSTIKREKAGVNLDAKVLFSPGQAGLFQCLEESRETFPLQFS